MRLAIGTKCETWRGDDGVILVDVREGADVRADVRRLPFRDNAFVGVECTHVLEHLLPNDARVAVRELWRVLTPGGVGVFAVPDMIACAHTLLAGHMEILLNIFSPHEEAAQRHRWGYTPRSFRDLLAGAGFVNIVPMKLLDVHETRVRATKPWQA